MVPTLAGTIERTLKGRDLWEPVILPASDGGAQAEVRRLVEEGHVAAAYDTLLHQLRELVDTRNPARKATPAELSHLVVAHLRRRDSDRYGNWVYYPWSRNLVRILPEDEFRELRTSRNRNKITAEEQAKLRSLRLGIVGLSVGQATAVTLALEEVGGEYLLADFDGLDLSNMNRLRAGVHDIGVNKAVLTARQIFEINPYARIRVFPKGIDESNIEEFLVGGRPLDLLFEECDDLAMKIRLRERAREHRIPVLMETSDRGLIDVERFDLEPDRPVLHGLIGDVRASTLKGLTTYEKVPIVLQIIGAATLSSRMAASLIDVETTLKTWPQLASHVMLGGALNTDTARRLALGQFQRSGRYYIDFEGHINDSVDGTPAPAGSYAVEGARGDAAHPLPKVEPASALSDTQIETLVAYAVTAPSGGNCQPWKFVYRLGELACRFDEERSRTLLDFDHTASFMAIGAAMENLRLAALAMGQNPTLGAFPEPEDPHLVCRVRFSAGGRLSGEDEELFAAVGRRVTNRKLGRREPLEASVLESLRKTATDARAALDLRSDPGELDTLAGIVARGERLRLLNHRMHAEMMGEVRWTSRDVDATRDGLDLNTLELTPTDLAGMRLVSSWSLMDVVKKLEAGHGLERATRKSIAAASAMGLLTYAGTDHRAWFEAGRALERVWLRATLLGLAFQPMTALLYLFARVARGGGSDLDQRELAELAALRSDFEGVFSSDARRAEVMLFRLARCGPASARSLRRPTSDVLTIER
ncbi:MAG TPA: Rv1355c family protein [Polyangiaceae bacterium]|nr:Rv1355c family protein [Polyangiaceae bacterium]